MKLFPEKLIFVTLLFLFFAGCKKNYVISGKQAVLFQFEYINYAWGYEHRGFIIDSDGNVLTFNNPERWNFPDKDFGITESQFTENIESCKQSGVKISAEELHKYSNYIKNISLSKVTALKNVAADAGSLDFTCYQYSENTKLYKGYLIKKEGDFTCENLNFFSKKVASWMRNINNSISKN